MFIGKGVIHKADDTRFICLGPWIKGANPIPVQFSNDLPRRDQIITRTINSKYSHIPERRAKAPREEEAKQIAKEATMGTFEAFSDHEIDLSDVISETILDEEKTAWIQNVIIKEAGMEPVETRQSKKILKRCVPYIQSHIYDDLHTTLIHPW